MAARRRAMVLHSLWRPLLAGAVGAALVIGAVWITLPKISYREVVVDHVVEKDVAINNPIPRDVPINNLIPHDVKITIPRIAAAPPTSAPTTPEERSFVASPGWKGAVVRGRILRAEANGFVTMTDQGEVGFYPAKIGHGGKIEPDPSVRDVVDSFIGALARCNQLPIGTYACVALGHDGRETAIAQAPIGAPL
jgi:hypothetical protein